MRRFHSFWPCVVTYIILSLTQGANSDPENNSLIGECKSDDDCPDPNAICQFPDDEKDSENSWSGKCTCNEFYKRIQPNPDILKCTRLTCSTNKDCSPAGYCGATGVCWPKCISDVECADGDTCNVQSGVCYRRCSRDEDCLDLNSKAYVCDLVAGICEKECDPLDGDICELPELCDSTGCHLRCEEESDCQATEYCDAATNFCLQIKCSADSDCGRDQYCEPLGGVCKAKDDVFQF